MRYAEAQGFRSSAQLTLVICYLFGSLALRIFTDGMLLAQAGYRFERRPIGNEELVYEMRTRTDGTPGELVAQLRIIASERDRVREDVEWLSVADPATGAAPSGPYHLTRYDLMTNPRAPGGTARPHLYIGCGSGDRSYLIRTPRADGRSPACFRSCR
jgi:hypothetical protein